MIANYTNAGNQKGGTPAVTTGLRQIDVGPVDAIPPGQGRAYVLGDRTIAVFRQRDGRLFATDNQCPHRGGPLAEGIVGEGTVICPLHSWKIDLETGRCVSDHSGMQVYPVTLLGGRIVLSVAE